MYVYIYSYMTEQKRNKQLFLNPKGFSRTLGYRRTRARFLERSSSIRLPRVVQAAFPQPHRPTVPPVRRRNNVVVARVTSIRLHVHTFRRNNLSSLAPLILLPLTRARQRRIN